MDEAVLKPLCDRELKQVYPEVTQEDAPFHFSNRAQSVLFFPKYLFMYLIVSSEVCI